MLYSAAATRIFHSIPLSLLSTVMSFDLNLLTENYILKVVRCMERHGYDVDDFEFSTQRIHGFIESKFEPKAIVYVYRVSTKTEKSYVLGEEPDFDVLFCADLENNVYDINK